MKRKCKACGTEFFFNVEALRKTDRKGVYDVNCPFCYEPKRVLYNHMPRHLKEVNSNEN